MSTKITDTFDPVAYSIQENQFLLDNLGLPTVVALRNAAEARINVNAVRPILDRVNDLEAQRTHSGTEWVGLDFVKDAIKTYLGYYNKWSQDRRRGRPRFPSMYAFDARNRAFLGGPGSDSGQVRTYFDKDGRRQRFEISLVPEATAVWEPDWVANAAPVSDDLKAISLKDDAENNRLECPVCNHTESYKPGSRSSWSAARARMSKHLRSDKSLTASTHLEVYTNEFRS